MLYRVLCAVSALARGRVRRVEAGFVAGRRGARRQARGETGRARAMCESLRRR